MDFKNFSTGVKAKPTQPQVDYSLYPKVWQGCGKCETETHHVILGILVKCLKCEHSYRLVTREEIKKQQEEELKKPIIATNNLLTYITKRT